MSPTLFDTHCHLDATEFTDCRDPVVHAALADTLQTPGFTGYGLQEKLQRLTDAVLERLLADREFVA